MLGRKAHGIFDFKVTLNGVFVSGCEARRRDAEEESVGGDGRDIGQPAGGEGQG